jgi:hypothetical protein
LTQRFYPGSHDQSEFIASVLFQLRDLPF